MPRRNPEIRRTLLLSAWAATAWLLLAPGGACAQWVILHGPAGYYARNIPDEAFRALGEAAKQTNLLKCIALAPGGGWVILHGRNGHIARNIPDAAFQALERHAKQGEQLRFIAFAPGGGWVIFYGRNGYLARNIPGEAFDMIRRLARSGAALKSIAFTPGGGWAILHGRNGYLARNIPDDAFQALGEQARAGAEIASISFTSNGGWVILWNGGYLARNIPDDAFGALGELSRQGSGPRSLSFLPRPTLRLSKDDAETRRHVLDRMAHYKIPGLSIALVDGGKIEWARGYGVARAGGGKPVTAETRFQAASISKPVSALGALRLVDAGKLELDGRLDRQLKAWKVPENEFTQQKSPTLRLVLSHSAGFTVHGFAGYESGARLPRLVDILDGRPPANSPPIRVEFVPGGKMQYSGGGYTVLQQLIVDVTGKPFPAVLHEQVLGPLEMKHSAFEQPPSPGFEAVAAEAHVDGKPLPGRWHVYPELAAAGLWTTPSDLARFVIALQRAKAGGRDPILSPRMIAEMLRHQPGGWGLGPGLAGSGRSAQFNHSGSNAGFECLMIGLVNTGQGAVLMANANGSFDLLNELAGSLRVEYGWPDR